MENLMLEPLKFYEQEGKSVHESLANKRFDELVKNSNIDVEQNRKTAEEYRNQESIAQSILKKLNSLKVWRVLLIVFCVIGYLIALVGFASIMEPSMLIVAIIGFVIGTASLLFILLFLNKRIKGAKSIYDIQKEKADKLLSKAYGQMKQLNESFSEKDTLILIEKSMPGIKFEDNYTVALSEEFVKNFDFVDSIDKNRSVINTLSGRFNGNPFLFYRYVNFYMGTKTYHGTKVISWTESVRGSDGKYRTVTRTQTLHASVSKPFPYYNYGTALGYGNQSAPDLSFSRNATDVEDLNDKQVEKRVKKGEKELKKLTEKAMNDGNRFIEMTNSEFDVLFGALDRNHEVQFRVMFSPIAQINMVKLLRAKEIGYGDDFSFTKRGRFNCIVSEHAQTWNMDTSPSNYVSYDVDLARSNFVNFNAKYFKSVFFDLAPLLSVPTYHQKPISVFEPLEKYQTNYTPYDYEVAVNTIGANKFAHPKTVTDVILKTKHLHSTKTTDCVQVTASSFAGESMVDFIPVFGRDGRMHSVPVPWVNYVPLQSSSTVAVKRLGVERKEFLSKTADKSVNGILFNTPSAYTHGLFAKIVNSNDVSTIDDVLEKIK